MNLPSVQEMEAYIRQVAAAQGVDPDTAVRVARSEGLKEGTWQATGTLGYGRERSYGPFQLHVAPTGYRGGMGNDMLAQTGLDPANPANWKAGVDFALGRAAKGGWSPWFGAKRIGVTGMMGIGGQPTGPAPSAPASGTAMGGFAAGPGAVAARQAPSPPTAFPAAPAMADDGWGLGDLMAGAAGGGFAPRQAAPQMDMPSAPPPADYASLSASYSPAGSAMPTARVDVTGMPEMGTLADLLGKASGAAFDPTALPQIGSSSVGQQSPYGMLRR